MMALAEDRDGAIWVGTTSGLSRWRQGVFEPIGVKEGVSGEVCQSFASRPPEWGLGFDDGCGAAALGWEHFESRGERVQAARAGTLQSPRGSRWGSLGGDGGIGIPP